MLNQQDITEFISEANKNSSREALELHELNFHVNKLTPLTKSCTKLFTSFFKKVPELSLKERFINSFIQSFAELIKYLKLLNMYKQF